MSSSNWDVETDVLVVGAGGCGLVAALTAREHGVRVTVLEKEDAVGGTTAMSGGSIVAAGTHHQRVAGISDTSEAFAEDILEHGDEGSDETLATCLAAESARTIEWLESDIGIEMTVNTGPYGRHGHRVPRRHWISGGYDAVERNGQTLIDVLYKAATARGIEILTNHPVTSLVTEDGAVVGVHAGKQHTERIKADAVLLSTGGFAANSEMRCERIPTSEPLLHWGSEGNTGDGIRMGCDAGGVLENMEAFLGFPTIAHPANVFVPWETSKEGAFVVGPDGRRVGDAGACAYSEFTSILLESGVDSWYLVFDQVVYDAMKSQPSTRDRWENCLDVSAFRSGDSLETLAADLGIDATGLAETVDAIESIDGHVADDGFTRTVRREFKPPYYGTEIEPAILQTQGGLDIDHRGRVLNATGDPIPNLYAGGGAAKSVSGTQPTGYLSGNGLLTALNLGRIMGDDAGCAVSGTNI